MAELPLDLLSVVEQEVRLLLARCRRSRERLQLLNLALKIEAARNDRARCVLYAASCDSRFSDVAKRGVSADTLTLIEEASGLVGPRFDLATPEGAAKYRDFAHEFFGLRKQDAESPAVEFSAAPLPGGKVTDDVQ